jgi:protein-S-isoprenylcysteine O-methyltransferase Ste14
MLSLLLRNLIFTILQPGLVAGLIPFLILGDRVKTLFDHAFQGYQYAGAAIFVIGFIIMLTCIVSFAIKGRGTISPADPTRQLVTTGLYRFSRNPMYVGVMLILIGEAILFSSTSLCAYVAFAWIAFQLFIWRFEEPRLIKDFGKEYNAYRKQVRRWI